MTRRQVQHKDVARELLPGQSAALLKELHLLTRDGNLNADSLRKLKQVNHLVRLLEPAVSDVLARFGEPTIVDCGAGKSYLGFVLYELFLQQADKANLVAIESRHDLAERGRAMAERLHFSRLHFVEAEIDRAPVAERLHLVTALHACDTATDDALALAIAHNADHIAVVPCCQAEVAKQLAERAERSALLEPLFAHGWHRREFGSHLTNVIRTLVLEAHGYKTTVTELTGWEHSLKNELILAKKVRASSVPARASLDALLEATGVMPRLVRVLAGAS